MASDFHLLAIEVVVAHSLIVRLAFGHVKRARIKRDVDFQLLWQKLWIWVKIG